MSCINAVSDCCVSLGLPRSSLRVLQTLPAHLASNRCDSGSVGRLGHPCAKSNSFSWISWQRFFGVLKGAVVKRGVVIVLALQSGLCGSLLAERFSAHAAGMMHVPGSVLPKLSAIHFLRLSSLFNGSPKARTRFLSRIQMRRS